MTLSNTPEKLSLMAVKHECQPMETFHLEGTIDAARDAFYTSPDTFVREIVDGSLESIRALGETMKAEATEWQGLVQVDFTRTANRPTWGTLSVQDDGIGLNFVELAEMIANIGRILRGNDSDRERWSRTEHGDKRVRALSIHLLSLFTVADSFTFLTCRAGDPHQTAYKLEGDIHGNYTLSKMSRSYEHGSVLCFDFKRNTYEHYHAQKLLELLCHWFEHSPHPVWFHARRIGGVCVSRRPFISTAAVVDKHPHRPRRKSVERWKRFAKWKFKESFAFCFSVQCSPWAVHGIGCILAEKLSPLHSEGHMAYAGGRFVSREIEGLAPDFVRCILEMGELPLNACQEGFVHTKEAWEAISRAVFEGLKKALEEIEARHAWLFLKLGTIHAESLQKIAKDHPDSVFSRIIAKAASVKHDRDWVSTVEDVHPASVASLPPPKIDEVSSEELEEIESFLRDINRSFERESGKGRLTDVDPQMRITPAYPHAVEGRFSKVNPLFDVGSMSEQELLNLLYRLDGNEIPEFLKELEREEAPEEGSKVAADEGAVFARSESLRKSAHGWLQEALEERDGRKRWVYFLRAQCAAIGEGSPERRDDILSLAVIYNIAVIQTRALVRLFWPLFADAAGGRLARRASIREDHFLLWGALKVLSSAPAFYEIPPEEIARARQVWGQAVEARRRYQETCVVRLELYHAMCFGQDGDARSLMSRLESLEREGDLIPSLGPGPGVDIGDSKANSPSDFGCKAFARQMRTLFFCLVGNDEAGSGMSAGEAVRARAAAAWHSARHDIAGRGACKLTFCALAPSDALAALLEPLHNAGMVDEAEQAHQLGFARVVHIPQAMGLTGMHLLYMVKTGAGAAAARLLEEILQRMCQSRPDMYEVQALMASGATPLARFHFLRGALAVLRNQGGSSERVERFHAEASDLASKFDKHNNRSRFFSLL